MPTEAQVEELQDALGHARVDGPTSDGPANTFDNPGAPATQPPRGTGNVLPENPSQLGHILRARPGHLPDTPANRQILEDVANSPDDLLGPDRYGNLWSGRTLSDGTQAWTQVRGGTIINGGVNQVPEVYNPETGLSASSKP